MRRTFPVRSHRPGTPPRALILTAGRGAGLGTNTVDRPASLVEVGGNTLISRQKAALRNAGVWRIGAVVGWRQDGFHGTDLTVFENPLWATTTDLDSLAVADDWLRRAPVIVHFGNVVCGVETVRRLAAAPGPVAVAYDRDWRAVWGLRFADPLAHAERFVLDRSRRFVADMTGRPAGPEEVHGQWLRLAKLTPASWAVLSRMREAGLLEGLGLAAALARLARRRLVPVTAVPAAGPWFPFDTATDLELGRDVICALDGLASA